MILKSTFTKSEEESEEMVGNIEDECNCWRLIIMLDAHGDDVEKYQSEDCDLECSGYRNIIECSVERMPRTLDQLLRFFLSKFCQSCVILCTS